MDKVINVFGDSHTYGDGLDDCGHVEPWKEHSSKTWPYHMFEKKLIVNVVDGIIYINEIHLEGKKSLKISDFLNGFKVPENSYFL